MVPVCFLSRLWRRRLLYRLFMDAGSRTSGFAIGFLGVSGDVVMVWKSTFSAAKCDVHCIDVDASVSPHTFRDSVTYFFGCI